MANTASAKMGGPDAGGYSFIDSKGTESPVHYNWIDITNGSMILGSNDDTKYSVSLPFTFNYYGTGYSNAVISTNGFLYFGSLNSNMDFDNVNIPSSGTPNNYIAPFWDDLVTMDMADAVYYATYGNAPNRVFIVEWHDMNHWSTTNAVYGYVTFEALLFENSSNILFQYNDVSIGDIYNAGGDATIGIENSGGTYGSLYSYKEQSLEDGLAILFFQGTNPTDNTPPSTGYTIEGPRSYGYGWYNGTVMVGLQPTDDLSGVRTSTYSVDYEWPWHLYSAPVPVSANGWHIIHFNSSDWAGNIEDSSCGTFQIDTVSPSTDLDMIGTVSPDGWFVSEVRITLTADDANGDEEVSGIDSTWYSFDNSTWFEYGGPFNVTNDAARDLYFYSIDRAGNYENVNYAHNNVDMTPPTVVSTLPANGKFIELNGNVYITFSEHLDPSTVDTSTIKMYDWYGFEIPCTLVYSGNTVTLDPNNDLGLGYEYRVVVSKDIQDVHGTKMASDYVFKFKGNGPAQTPGTFVPGEVKPTPVATPTPTPTPTPTATPTPTPSVTPTVEPTATPTPTPVSTPTATPTPTPTPAPQGDNIPMYLGILIVILGIIAIAGAAVYFLVFRK